MLKVLIRIGIAVAVAGFLLVLYACLKAASDADDEAGCD